MAEQMNIRQLVMEMLLAVTKEQEYSHIVIRDVQNKYNYLSNQEKSFMKRLFEGTLERMIEIDYILDAYSKVKVNKMKPVIRTIMRMGVYQIIYMDSVPDSAACNEAVKLAQKKGFTTLKGFVNGVLRNIARNKECIEYPNPNTDYKKYLSVKYSMPIWIVEMWLEQLGKERTQKVLEGLMQEHPVTIRFRNQEAQYIKKIEETLEQQGGSLEQQGYFDYAYRITKTDDIAKLPGYIDGSFVIQDVSSMLAIEALRLQPGMKVLDICAAPGGKSILAADKLKYEGMLEARDVSERKVELMAENFKRCKLEQPHFNIKAIVKDACECDENWIEKADVVIADVPCSGLGVIGKKRDIKYKMTAQAIKEIIRLQEEILEQAVKYVRPGGMLLFSTCTINKAENEAHVKLLEEKYSMIPVSLTDRLPKQVYEETANEGYIQLLPGIHDTDGFFISVFRKENMN